MTGDLTYKTFCVMCKGYEPTPAEELIDFYRLMTAKTPGGLHLVQGLAVFQADPHRFVNLCARLQMRGNLTVFRAIAEGWDLQRIIQELN